MGLKVHIKVDLDPWYRKNSRVQRAIKRLRPWEIYPPDEPNRIKARAAFDRPDDPSCYPISQEVLDLGAAGLAMALKEIAIDPSKKHVDKQMREFGKVALKDVKANIREGKVLGPDRTDEWERRKGNTTNMIGMTKGSGRFVRAITMRLVAPRR